MRKCAIDRPELERVVEEIVVKVLLLVEKSIAKAVREGMRSRSKAKRPVDTAPVQYPTDGLARIPEAARFLDISRYTVYRMIADNQLPHVIVRGVIRIPWKVLHKIPNRSK